MARLKRGELFLILLKAGLAFGGAYVVGADSHATRGDINPNQIGE